MRKHQTFFKVLYYIFMVVVVLILAIVLPQDNQYRIMNDYLENSVKTGNINQVPNLFSTYYNEDSVYSYDDSIQVEIFESQVTTQINSSSNYYSESIYMGFIANASDYQFITLTDANETEYNNIAIKYTDEDNKTYEQKMEVSYYNYVDSIGLVYFQFTEAEYLQNGLSNIKSLEFIQNDGSTYATVSNLNLDFNSDYFTSIKEYNNLYNAGYFNIEANLAGTFTKATEGTTLNMASSISFTTIAESLMTINSDKLLNVTVNDVILNPNTGTNTYTLSAGANVVITARENTLLEDVTIQYDNNINYVYSFIDNKAYPLASKVYSYEDASTKIGEAYNEETIYEQFTAWQENYKYNLSTYSEIVSGATPISIIQVAFIIVAFLIVGDFLVGSRMIWRFIRFIYRKIRKTPNSDDTSEETPVFNDYEVNVECRIIVPEGYSDEIHIVYQIKDTDNTMTFDLTKEKEYKTTNRFRNGIYELVEFKANNLELDNPKITLNVRGYKYTLELKSKVKE